MQRNERYFLNGIIRALKPKKILEVGVANGGGTALILNAISDIDGAQLYSVDYTEKSYRYSNKPSGFLVEEKFPQFMDKWHIFRGGDVSCFLEEIGGDIDLLVLDTVHTHPWETLNFLCILPFMKNDSWTVLHDIMEFTKPNSRGALACRYLFASIVSDEKIRPVPDDKDVKFANIGAFKVAEVTRKYIDNLFEALAIVWHIQLSDKDISDIAAVIKKYYSPEQYKFFCDVLELQEYMLKHPATLTGSIKRIMRQKTNPDVFAFLLKLKRSLKRL